MSFLSDGLRTRIDCDVPFYHHWLVPKINPLRLFGHFHFCPDAGAANYRDTLLINLPFVGTGSDRRDLLIASHPALPT